MMVNEFGEVLERVTGMPITNGKALCPAHHDSNPSLSVSSGSDGRILLKCHAGCTVKSIIAALRLEMRDLFPESGTKNWKIVAKYDYTDAKGDLLFQIVRIHPKSFRIRTPKGADGWEWGRNGTHLVPYRLPEIRSAVENEEIVLVVEGEKDVEALEQIGFTATTNPMGAGKWRDEYNQYLEGAHVVILPDNDEPGRKHAERIARSLQTKAQSVRIVELPGLRPTGDASDWIAGGGTHDALEILIRGTKAYNLANTSVEESVPGKIVADVDRKTVTWLWHGRIAEGKVTILDGDPGIGKSTLYCDLAARLTRGYSWPVDNVNYNSLPY